MSDAKGTTVSSYNGRGLHGQIVEAIGRRIVQGDYAEGDTLQPDALQREFGVSLTVIREALKVLAAKGIVDARPKRGTFVTARESWNLLDPDVLLWDMTTENLPRMLAQLGELRAIFEPETAALAAARRDEGDVEALRASFEAMTGTDDLAAVTDADLRFHRAVTMAAKNDLLTRVELLTRSIFAERDRLAHRHVGTVDALDLHRTLLDAIIARDADAARAAAEHIVGRAASDDETSVTRAFQERTSPRRAG
ncbi:FadR family transcriptional regulator [Microbacterium sp. JZ70]